MAMLEASLASERYLLKIKMLCLLTSFIVQNEVYQDSILYVNLHIGEPMELYHFKGN